MIYKDSQDLYHRFDPGDLVKMTNREYPNEYYHFVIVEEDTVKEMDRSNRAIFYLLYHIDDREYYSWCLSKRSGYEFEKVA